MKVQVKIMMKDRKAFTVLELVFVIAIIGILSAVAIPKFAGVRDDATISKAKSTVAAIRNAIATERQKKILKGEFGDFTSLGGTDNAYDGMIFDYFNGNSADGRVLEYGIRSCKNSTSQGCWIKTSDTTYDYIMPVSGTHVTFTFDLKSRFDCDVTDATSGEYCKMLSE